MRIAASIAVSLLLLGISGPVLAQNNRHYDLVSPGGMTTVMVDIGADGLTWELSRNGQSVMLPSFLTMSLVGGEMLDGWNGKEQVKAVRESKDEWILPLHYKKDSIRNRYNQLTLTFPKKQYGVVFRAYDDGAAYRWMTSRKDSLKIRNETAEFDFPDSDKAWIPYVNDPSPDIYTTSFENFYRPMRLSEFKKDTLAFLPVLVDVGNGRKAAILEADLEDYPGMFVGVGTSGVVALKGRFAPYPLEERQGGHNQLQSLVTRRADYIAVTAGTRSYPWRIIVISDQDRDLLDNDMVYRLASPSRVPDTGWIKPGKVAWDWWNDWNISHVDFRAGINTDTYKYYTDFAAQNHIGYILLDEGWSDPTDLMKIV
ncbi:MAG TPA: glycoside hydrolase family 97 N-terminal domain-containing protein, partial [Puia sp.]|nr:glycoside hydrolase family 97 N-terminal domain-containing protein [Puia sp.]